MNLEEMVQQVAGKIERHAANRDFQQARQLIEILTPFLTEEGMDQLRQRVAEAEQASPQAHSGMVPLLGTSDDEATLSVRSRSDSAMLVEAPGAHPREAPAHPLQRAMQSGGPDGVRKYVEGVIEQIQAQVQKGEFQSALDRIQEIAPALSEEGVAMLRAQIEAARGNHQEQQEVQTTLERAQAHVEAQEFDLARTQLEGLPAHLQDRARVLKEVGAKIDQAQADHQYAIEANPDLLQRLEQKGLSASFVNLVAAAHDVDVTNPCHFHHLLEQLVSQACR